MPPDEFLPGMGPQETPSQSQPDWFKKRMEIANLFSPTQPVREADLFVGRTHQIQQVTEGILQAGQHAVVYGERGVGKSSLVNIIQNRIFSDYGSVQFFKARCLTGHDFVDIWELAFGDYRWSDGTFPFDDVDDTLDANVLLKLVSKFPADVRPVFIFDEFDRITDAATKLNLAETIKLFSDDLPNATIIVVGVGKNVRELISEHESIRRAIKQVGMPRMSQQEIQDIISVRLDRASMSINSEAMATITWLARGMPAFGHLLGMNSAKAAIDRKTLDIDEGIVIGAIQPSLEEVDETTQEAYAKATQSPRAVHFLKQTLLACALATADEFGRFAASNVRGPLSRILRKDREIPDFNRHLKAFCTEERGHILEREGNPRNYHYRFRDPLMQSYVMMKGVRERMLPPAAEIS